MTINPRHLKAFCYQSSFIQKNHLADVVDLSKISAETLIVYGDEDEVSDLDDVYALRDKIKNAKLTIIRGIGHFLSLEDGSVMDVYDEFFASSLYKSNSYKKSKPSDSLCCDTNKGLPSMNNSKSSVQ